MNDNLPDEKEYKKYNYKLTPFKLCVLQNFPFIEADFDAITNYQLLCKVVEYLNHVIDNQNTVEDNFKIMADNLNTLYNYIDTLDLQEEVNNKLDEYATDGTLENIIASYLNTQKIYNTHEEMIQDKENLINNLRVQTLGYYYINDGGGAFYLITKNQSATEYQEEIDTNLYAQLIINNDCVTVEQLGAKGDGNKDDTDAINLALSLKAKNILFSYGKTYMVRGYENGQEEGDTTGLIATTGLIIPSNKIVDLNESTIKCITNSRKNYNIFTIAEVHDVTLKNGTIIGDRRTHTPAGTGYEAGQWGYGVAIKYSHNIILDNLKISECWGDGINLNNNGDFSSISENITIKNCICDSNRRQGMSIENGKNIYVTESSFINTGNNSLYNNPASGVDIEPGDYGNPVINVIFDKCNFNDNYNDGIILDGATVDNVKILNSIIANNKHTTSQSDIAVLESKNVLFENNTIYTDADLPVMCQLRPSDNLQIINNNIKNGRLLCYSTNLNNGEIKIFNNKFLQTRISQYNGIIETVDDTSNTTNKNNTLIVNNNEFIANGNHDIAGWIISRYQSYFNKLICKNNLFKYGKRGVSSSSSNIIKNNNFVALYEFPILLNSGYAYQVNHLDSNIFEECSFNANNAGVILNTNNNNIILQNNTIYKNCLSINDQQTRTYSPSRFLQNLNPTGITLDSNNNIFDNVIE